MNRTERDVLWVVYQMAVRNKPGLLTAVCEQSEWEAMELVSPGFHTLVRAGITNEGEAEQLARAKMPAPATPAAAKPRPR